TIADSSFLTKKIYFLKDLAFFEKKDLDFIKDGGGEAGVYAGSFWATCLACSSQSRECLDVEQGFVIQAQSAVCKRNGKYRIEGEKRSGQGCMFHTLIFFFY
ncbi:MAG: hypothetical protein ACFFDN_48165, partial [Candidatus Hodarchaeota archaeon]